MYVYIYIYGWSSQTFFIVHDICDNPSHWLIFFKMVETTNQIYINVGYRLVWGGPSPPPNKFWIQNNVKKTKVPGTQYGEIKKNDRFKLIWSYFQLISIYFELIWSYFELISIYFQLISIYFELISIYFQLISIYFELISIYFQLIWSYSELISIYFQLISIYFELISKKLSIDLN